VIRPSGGEEGEQDGEKSAKKERGPHGSAGLPSNTNLPRGRSVPVARGQIFRSE